MLGDRHRRRLRHRTPGRRAHRGGAALDPRERLARRHPTDVLRSLNRAVKNSGTGSFLTAIYATLDTTDVRPTLTVTSGGHPFPICVDPAANGAHTVGRPGTLLGMLDNVKFTTVTRQLHGGDVVVFHTDGATDLRPPHNLDDAEFCELVRRAVERGATAETIADQIHDALDAVLAFPDATTTSLSSC